MNITDLPSSAARHRELRNAAERLRRGSLISTAAAGSGHPSSCLSCAEIVSVLFFEQLRLDPENPANPHNDQFILSKGHAAPVLWSALSEAGFIRMADLESLREIDSDLEGHPTPRNPWVKVATGSLGQGLSMGLGMAWAARRNETGSHTYVLMGDGETAEGSVWEAAALASHYEMGNLTAIVDINRLGQSGPTMLGHDVAAYRRRFEAFGWEVQEVDGHSVEEVSKALKNARSAMKKPSAILALTLKGKGVDEMEDREGHHGHPSESVDEAISELDDRALAEEDRLEVQRPEKSVIVTGIRGPFRLPTKDYGRDEKVATRQAFGDAMLALAEVCGELVVFDGDVKNSTKLEPFFDRFPDRSVECFIAEQNMVGMAVGAGKAGMLPCVATFAAFLTRAFDQLRLAAISRSRLIVAGTHCGVAIGQDGPTQMGLEDLAMMRALPHSVVFHASDAVCTRAMLGHAASYDGISYLRLTRNKLPVIYGGGETFEPGGCKVLGESGGDEITLVGAGVTLHECIKAQKTLKQDGISARVVDCYSIKPIDSATLQRCASETGRVVIVEDHFAEGGIGEAVFTALGDTPCRRRHLAIRRLSRSGQPAELLDHHEISATHIVAAARQLMQGT